MSATENGGFVSFDHLHFWVGNAKQAAAFYTARFGFEPVAYRGLETRSPEVCTYVLKQGDIVIALSSYLTPKSAEFNQFISRHGDAVRDVAFTVEDARGIYEHAVSMGAPSVLAPTELGDEHGSVVIASVSAYNSVIHTFVERKNYRGVFMPGYVPYASKFPVRDPLLDVTAPVGLLSMDHVVGTQRAGEMLGTVDQYIKRFGFHTFWSVDKDQVGTKDTTLTSIVVCSPNEQIKMPFSQAPEDSDYTGQIEEFNEFNDGPGIQHVAILTDDIVHTVNMLKQRGVEFMSASASYYNELRERLSNASVKVAEEIDELEKLGILADINSEGYILQIFTRNIEDRPTFFFEIIQRRKHNGFGIGNFKELFRAIEQGQRERGTLKKKKMQHPETLVGGDSDIQTIREALQELDRQVIYEVSLELDSDIADAYVDWLRGHIEEILKIPGFIRAELETKGRSDTGKELRAVKYTVASQEQLQSYFDNHAQKMREEALVKFPGRFTATRRTYAIDE